MNEQWMSALPLDNVKDISPVSGGDVNEAFKVTTVEEDIFFLLVQRQRSEAFYAAEIAGLNEFENAGITAPRVIASGEINGDAYLLLSFLEEGSQGSQRELARLVARMHSQYQQDNKFGFRLPHEGADISFDNSWTNSWKELFIERRMDHLRDELMRKGLWNEEDNKVYEVVRTVMVNELDSHESKSSLLHGDLWGGNYMFLTDGSPALFDPAPLYGDREFDLGITTVFGGFTQDFYEEYEKHFPLAKGAQKRLEFYRLYLLMVHLVKFGNMYAGSVNRSMDTILN